MGSKKHHRRDSSSSSEDGNSSDDSPKGHRKHHSDSDKSDKYSKRSRSRSRNREYRRATSTSEERSCKHRPSRSRSNERSSYHRHRSRESSQSRDHRREDNRDSHSRHFKYSRGSDRPDQKYDSRSDDRRRENHRAHNSRNRRSRSKSFDHANARWGKPDDQPKDKKKIENNARPNFALSGKLTEETNTYKGVVIKYSEPPEARKPRRRWRLYPFKGEKALQTLYIHRESAYLIGRDRKVVDLPVDHPSCSKQHAALQYRLVPFTRENGTVGKRVRPYLIDLDSANGTFINNKKIESRKYVELLERDVIKFGFSSREYVLLHENSKDESLDDDVKMEEEEIKEEVDIKEERE